VTQPAICSWIECNGLARVTEIHVDPLRWTPPVPGRVALLDDKPQPESDSVEVRIVGDLAGQVCSLRLMPADAMNLARVLAGIAVRVVGPPPRVVRATTVPARVTH